MVYKKGKDLPRQPDRREDQSNLRRKSRTATLWGGEGGSKHAPIAPGHSNLPSGEANNFEETITPHASKMSPKGLDKNGSAGKEK